MIADDRLAVVFDQQLDRRAQGVVVTGDVAGADDLVDTLAAEQFERLAQRRRARVHVADEAEPGRHWRCRMPRRNINAALPARRLRPRSRA